MPSDLKCPWCKANLIYEEHSFYNNGKKQHKEYKLVCPNLDFETKYFHKLNILISSFKRTNWRIKKNE